MRQLQWFGSPVFSLNAIIKSDMFLVFCNTGSLEFQAEHQIRFHSMCNCLMCVKKGLPSKLLSI